MQSVQDAEGVGAWGGGLTALGMLSLATRTSGECDQMMNCHGLSAQILLARQI